VKPKFIKERLLPAACSWLPFTFWEAVTGANPAIAYYHLVSDAEVPHVKHLYQFRNIGQFRKDIDTFCRSFRPISLFDLLASLRQCRALPPNSFLLTFDDGFREIYDVVAPILREKGVPATFFLTTACLDNKTMAHHNKISLLIERTSHARNEAAMRELWRVLSDAGIKGTDLQSALLRIDYRDRAAVDGVARILEVDFASYLSSERPYLASEQVRELIQTGFAIGGHSVDHPLYATLSLEEQLSQTRTSVRCLRESFSLNYGAFAFPHGHNNVGPEFFNQLFSEPDVDVCFGTAGLLKNALSRHFHRFSMENTRAPARRVVAGGYARGFYRKLVGSSICR
jgi:peptidoglycan/xylan/chitin deacetylase (PgdA/CDA1 family)